MTDPMGMQGISHPMGDVEAAFEGGSTFDERIRILAAKKEAADQAIREAGIAKQARAALDEANTNLARSKTIRASAEADAKAAAEQADKARKKGQDDADKIVAGAVAAAKKLADEAAAAHEKAKAETGKLAAESAQDRAKAASELDAAKKKNQDAHEIGQRHAIAKNAAEKAAEDAKAAQARYEAKLARIEAFAAELRGNGS